MAQGLAREGFDLDLAYGKSREDALARVLHFAKVEVKSDQQCIDTGNFFLEYKQKGRPSGIAVTSAEYWAIEFMPDRFFLIRTEELKAIARRYWKNNRVKGGDFNQFGGILIPITEFLPKKRKPSKFLGA